jgi:hypothetical protein
MHLDLKKHKLSLFSMKIDLDLEHLPNKVMERVDDLHPK